jgi:Rrf2 family protein
MKFVLQRKTDLALRALRELEAEDGPLQATQLAELIGSTPNFLPQVMSSLVRSGWVVSSRGPTGGYLLVASLEALSVLQVIEAVEGPTITDTCVLRGGTCGVIGDLCSIHLPWAEARTAMLDKLDGTPVQIKTNAPK